MKTTDLRNILFWFVFIGQSMITFSVRAQSGPGGVGSSANNVIWLDANSGVFNNAGTTPAANGDNVQQWNDRSGNAKNASQSVAGVRPNYVTGVVNSLPVLRFTSANNDIILAAGVSTANLASTWVVAAYSSLPSSNPGIVIGAPPGTGTNVGATDKCIGVWVNNGAGTQLWGRGVQSNNTQRNITQVTTLNANTFYVINTIFRGAAINQFVNNAAAGDNTAHNGTLKSWADISVGRQGNESWNGDITEVIFYNVEVNSAQRIIVDNYMAAKYGLTLTSNDVYNKDDPGNGNYDFEMAGIGRVDASNIHADAQGSGIVRILNPSGLGDNEFLLWGHDNAITQANNTTDVPTGVQGRMVRVWRLSEVNAASASVDVGSVDIRFDLSGLGAITASDLRLLVDTDNDGVFTDETGISGASLVSGAIYQFTGVTALTNNVRFSLGTINKIQTPLPVELLYFQVQFLETGEVLAKWETAAEKNSSCFEVQRSLDGTIWEEVTKVEAAGWSTHRETYTALDEHPYQNTSYYRLKKIDLDGHFSYSPIRSVRSENSIEEIQVYPNPTGGKINIQTAVSNLSHIVVLNALGQDLTSSIPKQKISEQKVELDLSELQTGIYFLQLGDFFVKIIKQ